MLRFFFFLFTCIPFLAFTQDTSEADAYQQFLREQQQGIQSEENAFVQYKAEVTKQFDDWTAEQERLFKEYTGQIEKKWGKKNVKTSTNKEYVTYSDDFASRKSVDFEKGKAKVEIIVSASEAKNSQVIQELLKKQVESFISEKGGNDPLEKKNSVLPNPEPILNDQVVAGDGKPISESNAKQFAEQAVQPAEIKQEVVTGKDGIKRIVIGVQFPLVPNHVRKRATDFKKKVLEEASRNKIEPTLVFAIMHTESYFNPMAKSFVPAYGLMQLVPRSGGRDAYLFVHGKDSLVTGEYLFVPENNIELGAGYLAKLMTVDFKGVEDMKSRLYCAISAYNTGAGNVAKAFIGKRSVKMALAKINSMSSDEVFDHLKKFLPFEETQKYVAKVSERMGLYNEWVPSN